MGPLLVLLIATVASFIGSLQAGLVNTAVLTTTLRSGRPAGRLMAWGGSVPEFLYAAVSFQGAEWLMTTPMMTGGMLERIAGSFLLALGLYIIFLLKPFVPPAPGDGQATGGFWKGVLVGLMNPQLLVFWCGVRIGMGTLGLQASGWIDMIAFGTGAFIGALILLMLLVRIGDRLHTWLRPNTLRTVFRLLGSTLVILGVLAWVRTF